jgi:hypothetical protein
MIDRLECATKANRRPSHEMCDALRMEQLSGVAALLIEIEQRLESVAQLFDDPPATDRTAEQAAEPCPSPTAFNPDATTRDAARRQAMIDDS